MPIDQILIIGLIALASIATPMLIKAFGKGRQQAADILGLQLDEKITAPPDPNRPDEVPLMTGHLHGLPATVFVSVTNRRVGVNVGRERNTIGQAKTHLALALPHPSPLTLTISPILNATLYREPAPTDPVVPTNDTTFDQAFLLSSNNPETALNLIDAPFRQQLIDLRRSLLPSAPNNAVGHATASLLMGRLTLEPDRLRYTLRGTPNAKIANHLQAASMLMAQLIKKL
ncbi:hypothetical protein FEM03_21910 [Phragmitibacter flavus]|uniref:Uncharacterized protein n=1 Tax=Phragmitibacter flavus TaxID=2576071 RepID=A0A5R8K8B0_9BACT|nr:hypothetical protein [Phragmitibacter flavus]TLD68577.1 hypothetical protein FEM03_21910 [Phragmitibacter flavus]